MYASLVLSSGRSGRSLRGRRFTPFMDAVTTSMRKAAVEQWKKRAASLRNTYAFKHPEYMGARIANTRQGAVMVGLSRFIERRLYELEQTGSEVPTRASAFLPSKLLERVRIAELCADPDDPRISLQGFEAYYHANPLALTASGQRALELQAQHDALQAQTIAEKLRALGLEDEDEDGTDAAASPRPDPAQVLHV